MSEYSMPRYFQNMPVIGEPTYGPDPENEQQLKATEAEFKELIEKILAAGRSDESLNSTGQLTAMQRIRALPKRQSGAKQKQQDRCKMS